VFIALLVAFTALGQNTTIRTTVPLVTLSTSVTDGHGQAIEGLTAADFVLLDGSTPKPVSVDLVESGLPPIALVILVETRDLSLTALAKIRKVGAIIPEAVVGENGEAALLTFDDDVRVLCDFTRNPDLISEAFANLQPHDASHARIRDATHQALDMLATRPGPRRSSILIIGESRDRGSKITLDELRAGTQRTGVTVYGMHYSTLLTPFTAKPDDYQPTGDPITGITQLADLGKADTLKALAMATGGFDWSFQVKSGLEKALMKLSADIHTRYLLSFPPDIEKAQSFHEISLQIRNRPDAVVRTRPGYWSLPQAADTN
jgi:VWFA-related protein